MWNLIRFPIIDKYFPCFPFAQLWSLRSTWPYQFCPILFLASCSYRALWMSGNPSTPLSWTENIRLWGLIRGAFDGMDLHCWNFFNVKAKIIDFAINVFGKVCQIITQIYIFVSFLTKKLHNPLQSFLMTINVYLLLYETAQDVFIFLLKNIIHILELCILTK